MKPGRVVALVLACSVIAFAILAGPPVWKLVTLERVYRWGWWYEGSVCHSTIIEARVPRFATRPRIEGLRREHYWQSGLLASESLWRNGTRTRETRWAPDGSIVSQWRLEDEAGAIIPPGQRRSTTPPWWWHVKEQTEPTARWWSVDEDRAVWWPDPSS